MRQGMRIVGAAIRLQPGPFAVALTGSILFAVATVAYATVLGAVIARLVAPAIRSHRFDPGAAVAAALAILLIGVMKTGGILLRRIACGRQHFALLADTRKELVRRCIRLPYTWCRERPSGTLLSAVANDTDAAWQLVSTLPIAMGALAVCVLATVMLLVTDPVLAAAAVGLFPLLVLGNVLLSRCLAPSVTRAQQHRAELAQVAVESIDGAETVRLLGRADAEAIRFVRTAAALRDEAIEAGKIRAWFHPLSEGVPMAVSLALLVLGVARLRAGVIDVEELLFVTLLFSAITYPVSGLGWMLAMIPAGVVGWDRVRMITTVPLPCDRAEASRRSTRPFPPSSASELVVRDVSYQHPGGRTTLDGVSVRVAPGRTLAVAGATGAGKTTFARILVGLLPPEQGTVHVDGIDLCTLPVEDLPGRIGYVPQDGFLFDDTVRANLAPDDRWGAEEEAMWRALRLARADDFVAALPGGLDEPLGERGARLSGGQRQRIAVARALLPGPRLVVLDNATAALDPQVESTLLRGLQRSFEGTTVIVTDRHESLACADDVLFLDNGRIRGRGTHAELLAVLPAYARLVQAHRRPAAGQEPTA